MVNEINESEKLGKFILTLTPEIISVVEDGYKRIEKSPRNEAQDITTNIDFVVDNLLQKRVFPKFNNVSIDSEEGTYGFGNIVIRTDPIDGSKHLRSGIDLFAILISVSYNDVTRFATIINPLIPKVYHAFKDKGAFLNGKPIHVNTVSIAQSFVMHEQPIAKLYSDDRKTFNKNTKLLERLMSTAFRLRNVGVAGLAIPWVADGAACAYVDLSGNTKLYDIEAPLLLALEAGAVVGDFSGKKLNKLKFDKKDAKKHISDSLIISTPKAYKEIVTLFNK